MRWRSIIDGKKALSVDPLEKISAKARLLEIVDCMGYQYNESCAISFPASSRYGTPQGLYLCLYDKETQSLPIDIAVESLLHPEQAIPLSI